MKDIPGYEGLYAITEDGKVWSYITNRFLKMGKRRTNGNSYLFVVLVKNKVKKNMNIHRLVALTYSPNGNGTVNHKNGIKDDNRLENLEWCTQSENVIHGLYILGGKIKKVGKYNKKGFLIQSFRSVREASREHNLNASHISECARGDGYRKTHGGFIWKYI